MKLDIYANRVRFGDGIELLIVDNGLHTNIGSLTFTQVEEGDMVDPTLKLQQHEAQMLIDQLWDCGIRPTEGSGSAGSLKATQDHLSDMQKIAFNLLEKV